ncbi:MAG: hypothetical protein R3C16_12825 [Hyphomonadaceae bacterium]
MASLIGNHPLCAPDQPAQGAALLEVQLCHNGVAEQVMRVGLRLFHNPGWMGREPCPQLARARCGPCRWDERPHVTLLTAAPAAEEIAAAHADLGDAIAPFQETARLARFRLPRHAIWLRRCSGAMGGAGFRTAQAAAMPELFSQPKRRACSCNIACWPRTRRCVVSSAPA